MSYKLFCAILSLRANGGIQTTYLVFKVECSATVLLEHTCVLQTFCAISSIESNGSIKTLYLILWVKCSATVLLEHTSSSIRSLYFSILSKVFFHCATGTYLCHTNYLCHFISRRDNGRIQTIYLVFKGKCSTTVLLVHNCVLQTFVPFHLLNPMAVFKPSI